MSWNIAKTYTASVTVHVEISTAVVEDIEYMFRDARAAGEPRPIIPAIKLLRDRTKIVLAGGSHHTIGLRDAKEIVEDIFASL